jgi:hypothetical protein
MTKGLEEEAKAMNEKLKVLVTRIGEAIQPETKDGESPSFGPPLEPEEEGVIPVHFR